MHELKPRELEVFELVASGKSTTDIAISLGLAESSVRTYYARAKAKMSKTGKASKEVTATKIVKPKSKAEAESEVELRRVSSFEEFRNMMSRAKVKCTTLQDRVQEFKDVYCKVCIYPSRCKVCPTKVLMDKYLF